jgi:hypothetical protein
MGGEELKVIGLHRARPRLHPAAANTRVAAPGAYEPDDDQRVGARFDDLITRAVEQRLGGGGGVVPTAQRQLDERSLANEAFEPRLEAEPARVFEPPLIETRASRHRPVERAEPRLTVYSTISYS